MFAAFFVASSPGLCHHRKNSAPLRALAPPLGLPQLVGEDSIGLRISILASGSSGNLTLLETERTSLLVDAGLGKRETLARLAAIEKSVDRLDGILITHEHSDHCNGLPQMLGLWKAPLYVTEPTMDALKRVLPERLEKRLRGVETIHAGQHFSIGDIDVHAFAIPHDAADPVGFTFRAEGTKMALVTDLGYMPELVKVHLRDADCLLLESNHDLEMLKVGPYPWVVKQRVMSRTGHLSNNAVGEYLSDPDGFDGRARYLVLAHISQENNNPDVVRISAEQALERRPSECAFGGELLLASQHVPLKTLQL
ncbi:MAG TPA: MBL fold metallo-hydrolase [Dongiaceae bacterium]|nr:MBL fold metallo-hydrolase [Dongiaceae bacterium]